MTKVTSVINNNTLTIIFNDDETSEQMRNLFKINKAVESMEVIKIDMLQHATDLFIR